MWTSTSGIARPSWQVRSGTLIVILLMHGCLLFLIVRPTIEAAVEEESVVRVFDVSLEKLEPTPARVVELQLLAPPPPQVPAPELIVEEAPTPIQSDLPPLDTPIRAAANAGDGVRPTALGGGGLGEGVGSGDSIYTKCTNRVMPFYPNDARNKGQEGRVTLLVEMDERGRFTRISVGRSSGFPKLDAAGIDALKRWRCSPVIENGRPVRVMAKQEFDFSLRRK